ncbi:MAG: DUF1223 domain-containing protein [Flavobacteriaceae bacterium]
MTLSLTRRGTLAGLAAASVIRPAFAASASVDVLELFTSQGCSSCPPADRLLGTYAADRDVLALSYNVDYWDYLGWKDTLAKHAFTERQYAYSRVRGDNRVYTPQVVVNGAEHAVGSDRSAIESARRQTRHKLGDIQPAITLAIDGGSVRATVGSGRASGPATLFMAAFASDVQVMIERGENAGRSVTYHNVVRTVVSAGSWTGREADLAVDRAKLGGGADTLAAFVQSGDAARPGPILAAATLALPG